MMIKFNKFERVAGIFILVAMLGAGFVGMSVAIKQGWFEDKIYYSTYFENADGVHPGTLVQMAGLRAGSVTDVDLQNDNKIKVSFYVQGKFKNRIKSDSQTQLIRPFIIGDRVLEVTVGAEHAAPLAENSTMPSNETIDVMTLMSGKKLGNYLSRVSNIMENLHDLVRAFTNKERTSAVVRIFDRLDPLVANLNDMSIEMTKMGQEVNKILPGVNKSVGKEIPQTAKRAVEALNEATILIKAMQRSFFVRGSVTEVRDEESRRMPSSQRNPSSNPVNSCEDVK